MTNQTAPLEIDFDELEPVQTPLDAALANAEELVAHLARLKRAVDGDPFAAFETLVDVGQDALELTDLLRTFAVRHFLAGVEL
jgi:hypothetical protein